MTDDRLEKVRKEVKRLLEIADHRIDNNRYTIDETGLDEDESARVHAIQKSELTYLNGEAFAYQKVLFLIDSMQEEPKFKIGQTITDPEDSTFTFHINKIEDGKYIESDDAWVLTKDADEEYELVEEPVTEDLEEAAKAYSAYERGDDTEVGYDINRYEGFIAGAKWQAEQFEKNRLKHCNSITNEQAELEQGFIDQHLDKHQRMPTFLDAIEYGMKLMKEQMMKDAVDGEVGEYYPTTIHLDKDIPELKHFDKVKMIIIMED